MKRGAAADGVQDRAHAVVVLDQQLAGGRAHEDLDAGRARQPLQLGRLGDILVRAADEEGEVAMHAARRALDLVGERFGARRQRIGVRHLEHGGDAAHDRAREPDSRSSLWLAGLAEMHLGVDHAGQDVQARGVDDSRRPRRGRDRRSRRSCRRISSPAARWPGKDDPLYVAYHDTEWGVPEYDDRALFEKLLLDGFQAGLSWITILRKRDNFRRAFDGFDPEKIARYDARKKVDADEGRRHRAQPR
jgi:hypothetical protein